MRVTSKEPSMEVADEFMYNRSFCEGNKKEGSLEGHSILREEFKKNSQNIFIRN